MGIDLVRRRVRNGDVELAVFEGGRCEGPTILLVHGWPDTHRLWHRVAPRLATAGFRVVAYDTRGQGESTGPAADDGYRVQELVEDFFAVVEAVSAGEPVHVLAHDWGSVQVWSAVRDPRARSRVASFTSISGPDLAQIGSWARRHLSRPTLQAFRELAGQGLSSAYVGFFVSPLAPPAFRRFVTTDRWRRLLRRVEGIEVTDEEVAPTLPGDMVNGLRYYRANVAARPPAPARHRTTVTVPVLLLVPTRDLAIRDYLLDEVPRWAANVQRVDVAGGHWLPLSRPDVVARETARFIASLRDPGGPPDLLPGA